ncbi:MAG: hypothetical protein ACJ77K_10830 [Bacteroidia bacterium]
MINQDNTVEIFKTNVGEAEQAERLLSALRQYYPGLKINLDLEDCDKILRLEGSNIIPSDVVSSVLVAGFHCEPIE